MPLYATALTHLADVGDQFIHQPVTNCLNHRTFTRADFFSAFRAASAALRALT